MLFCLISIIAASDCEEVSFDRLDPNQSAYEAIQLVRNVPPGEIQNYTANVLAIADLYPFLINQVMSDFILTPDDKRSGIVQKFLDKMKSTNQIESAVKLQWGYIWAQEQHRFDQEKFYRSLVEIEKSRTEGGYQLRD